MKERPVTAFLYGSYMNLDVLQEVDLRPAHVRVARLPGFDIYIAPLASGISLPELEPSANRAAVCPVAVAKGLIQQALLAADERLLQNDEEDDDDKQREETSEEDRDAGDEEKGAEIHRVSTPAVEPMANQCG